MPLFLQCIYALIKSTKSLIDHENSLKIKPLFIPDNRFRTSKEAFDIFPVPVIN